MLLQDWRRARKSRMVVRDMSDLDIGWCILYFGSGLHWGRHFYPFYAAAVDFQDGELKVSAGDDVVYFWDIAREFEDQACQGVAFPFHLVKRIDRDIHYLTDIVEHCSAFEDIGAVVQAAVD